MAAGGRVLKENGARGLLSTGDRALYDASGDCPECCESCDFCSQCGGNAPALATATGFTNGSETYCTGGNVATYSATAYLFNSTPGSQYCRWTYDGGVFGTASFYIYFFLDSVSLDFAGCGTVVYPACSWMISAVFGDAVWTETTTGFACSSGVLAGTHSFGARCAGSDCAGTPTFTVPVS